VETIFLYIFNDLRGTLGSQEPQLRKVDLGYKCDKSPFCTDV
jgi:hypothetical protein